MNGDNKKIRIGVLALQGDFAEHISALQRADGNVEAYDIRYAGQMLGDDAVDALVIPGGESTAIARLVDDGNDPLFASIKERAQQGMPIYGTCMGSIFLARDIENSRQGRLALMDIGVKRNAFGAQRRSFEIDIEIEALGPEPFPAVFIRAPLIAHCGPEVTVMATIKEGIVMARQGNLLVSAFHPEIVEDSRVHKYFIDMVRDYLKAAAGNGVSAPVATSGLVSA